MMKTNVISKRDLDEMKNIIDPHDTERETRKSIDEQLKMISQERVKNWPNSLENANKLEKEKWQNYTVFHKICCKI